MDIQTKTITEAEMSKKGGFGKKTWNHEAIANFLGDLYNHEVENNEEVEEGDKVVKTFLQEDGYNEWVDNEMSYKEYINEKSNPHATFCDQVESNVSDGGFMTAEEILDSDDYEISRKSLVGYSKDKDGRVWMNVILIPKDED